MARDEQIRVDLVAKDDASKVIGKVADAAAELEKIDPEIVATADVDQAEREIDRLGDDVREIQRADAEIVLRAKVDAAKAELQSLQGELKQVGEKADTTARQLDRVDGPSSGGGLNTRGNAIADLTGPLGEASGAASDFAGVFDGLGDIAEDVAGKLGASASTSAAVSSALGGLGIAVAAGAALWSYWSGQQKKAKEAADKTREAAVKLNEALRSGNVEQFADQLVEQYGDVFDAAKEAGLSVAETTDFIANGARTVPTLEAALQSLEDQMYAQVAANGKETEATREQYSALISLKQEIIDARQAYEDGEISAADYQSTVDAVTGAVRKSTGATDTHTTSLGRNRSALDSVRVGLDNIRNGLNMEAALVKLQSDFDVAMWNAADGVDDTTVDVLGLKSTVLDLADTAKANPAEVRAVLKKIDQGDLAGAKADAEAWYARNPVNIKGVIRPVSQGVGSAGGGGVPLMAMAPPPVASSGGAPVVNVTQYLPRGYRERDTLAAAQSAAKRAGGYYRRAHR
jgi:hypothetical protein